MLKLGENFETTTYGSVVNWLLLLIIHTGTACGGVRNIASGSEPLGE